MDGPIEIEHGLVPLKSMVLNSNVGITPRDAETILRTFSIHKNTQQEEVSDGCNCVTVSYPSITVYLDIGIVVTRGNGFRTRKYKCQTICPRGPRRRQRSSRSSLC